jgi:predicted AlkP superfamily phosphohydrolase/phosphomutase
MSRVAAIGLDAMEWSVVERLMAEGELPHLRALRDRAAWCQLETVVPYRSELPWTLFVTGRTPETNRYWSTATFDPASYEVYTVGAHVAQPFYALGPGKKVIAFDVPHTVPDENVHGVQVMAWGAHSPQYPRASSPPGLLTEIDERFGPHPGFGNDYDGSWHVPQFVDKLADAQLEGAARRVDILQWLQEREPDWDFLVTVMSEPHSAGHHLLHGIEPDHPLHDHSLAAQARARLLDVYRGVDEHVGRLVRSLPPETVVVVFAVHGMQPNANDVPSMVLLPELLHRLHFGKALLSAPGSRRWKREGMPPLRPNARHAWETTIRHRFGEGLLGRTRRAASAVLPDGALEHIARLRRRVLGMPEPRPAWDFRESIEAETTLTREEIRDARGKLDWQVPSWYRQYWPEMRWFVLPTFSDAHVRINLAGRERDGIVPLAEYEQACDEFEVAVRACRNPRTGEPAVRDVIRMRSDDPMAPDGPDGDLVVLWNEPMDAMEHPQAGLVGPVAFNRTGEHSSNGFAMIAGPGVEPRDLGVRSAYDLTATLLRLLGGTPTPEMPGRDLLDHQGTR